MFLSSNRFNYILTAFILPTVLLYLLSDCLNLANAYDWSNDYGVTTGVGFHDNYRLTDEDETDSSSIEFGGFVGINRSTEISQVGLVLRARNQQFSDSSIDEETSYNVALNTSRAGERLSSSLGVSYDQASTTQTELLDTGVNRDGKRKTLEVSPGLTYQLDEKNALGTNLSYRDVTYDTVSLTEYTNTSLSLSWIYQFKENQGVTTSYVYSVYDPDNPADDGDTKSNSLNLGYGFQTSEATVYNITVGVVDVDEPQGSTTSGTGAFNVNHQTDDRNIFTLALSKSYEGSGRGNVRKEERINMGWNHSLSDRSQATLSVEGVNTSDRDYFSIRAGYNYNYTREVVLSSSYRFRTRTEDADDSFGVDSATSNTLLFTLSYSSL